MKKITYITINVIAVTIAVCFIIYTSGIGKLIGVIILAGFLNEYFSGRYKKYVGDQVSEAESKEESKKFKKMLFPFIILAIVFFILFLVYAFQNWL